MNIVGFFLAGFLVLAALQVLVPLIVQLADKLLLLVLSALFGFGKQLGPREAALAEASQGAAMIALAALTWLHMGHILPHWFPLAALAVMFWGCLKLNNGAKLSVGWRDPKLITGALVRTGVGVAIYVLVLPAVSLASPYGGLALWAVVVWCVVTGMTKLVLVLRGFPAAPWSGQDPGMPHGGAGFSGPDDPGWKL